MPTLDDVTTDCPSCGNYIETMSPMYRSRWLDEVSSYKPNPAALDMLKKLAEEYEIVVLFADWCGDARRAVPALAVIEAELGIRVRALGGMTKPGFGSGRYWAIPPSPIEVDIFDIRSSPTILLFRKDTGEEIGRIKTRPKMTPTIEEEMVKVIEDYNVSS
ncbi:MAG: thioredoxin family protein [Candidatus Thorarchaeota archaeon]